MKTKYDIQQQTTTTELQAPDLGQAHTECGRVKLVCWGQNVPFSDRFHHFIKCIIYFLDYLNF